MYQNYITGQTTLPLNLDFSIPVNHTPDEIFERELDQIYQAA